MVLNQVPLNAGGDYGYYTNNYAYYSEAGDGEIPAQNGAMPPMKRRASMVAEGKDRLVLRERDKE